MKLLRRRQHSEPPKPQTTDPARRLRSLRKKRFDVIEQLANPNLDEDHRPRIVAKLASIEDEIAQLKELVE